MRRLAGGSGSTSGWWDTSEMASARPPPHPVQERVLDYVTAGYISSREAPRSTLCLHVANKLMRPVQNLCQLSEITENKAEQS